MRTRPVLHAVAAALAATLALAGTAHAGVVAEAETDGTATNNSIATAQNLDANFTSGTTPNAFGNSTPGWQTTSVDGAVGEAFFQQGDGDSDISPDVDFYEFTLGAPRLVVLDIDSGGLSDMTLWLFDSSGQLLFFDDQSTFSGPANDPGSTNDDDPFIGEVSLAAGTYYAAVSAFSNPALVYVRYYDTYFGDRAGIGDPMITGYGTVLGAYGTGGPYNYGAFSFPTGFSSAAAMTDSSFLYSGNQPVNAATDGPYTLHISVNPEPSTLALFGLGALGLLGAVRRRRRRPSM